MNISDPEIAKSWESLLSNSRAVHDGWTSPESQELLITTHETLAAVVRERFGGTLDGRFVVRCGMDKAGGACSLVSGWRGAAFLGIDADAERIKRHTRTGFCDYLVTDLREAIRILRSAVHARKAAAVGLAADPSSALAEMARLGVVPDLLMNSWSSNAGAPDQLRRWGTIILHE
jgi:urocanate hydratase